MKTKIAIICDYVLIPDRIGGMDRFFVAYDRALKELGCEVKWYFSRAQKFSYYNFLEIIEAGGNNLEDCFISDCLDNKLEFNIVITHFIQVVSPFFKRIKQLMPAYIIAVDHNSRPLNGVALKKQIKNGLKGLIYSKYVDRLIGVSKYSKNQILNDYGKYNKHKTEVIYNGVDIKTFETRDKILINKPLRLITVAYLQESKGIQDLILALSKIDKKYVPNIQVDIFGVGPLFDTLVELVRTNELEQVVKFKGNSPKLYETYCNYNYFVLPTHMECFSLSILESLASNVPVITTTVGGNTEIIEDGINGFLFEPKDVEKLTQLLEEIITAKIGIKSNVSKKIEEGFTLEIMVANHIKLVEECI